MKKILIIGTFLVLAACHDDDSQHIERVTCIVNGETVVHEAVKFSHLHPFSRKSWVGDETVIKDINGSVLVRYSAAVPCTLIEIPIKEAGEGEDNDRTN